MIVKLCIIVINDNAIYFLNLEIKKNLKKRFCFVCVILFAFSSVLWVFCFFCFCPELDFTVSTDMVILELMNLFKTFYLRPLRSHSELLLHVDLSLNLFIVYLHFYLCDFSFNTQLLKVDYR